MRKIGNGALSQVIWPPWRELMLFNTRVLQFAKVWQVIAWACGPHYLSCIYSLKIYMHCIFLFYQLSKTSFWPVLPLTLNNLATTTTNLNFWPGAINSCVQNCSKYLWPLFKIFQPLLLLRINARWFALTGCGKLFRGFSGFGMSSAAKVCSPFFVVVVD